MSKQFLVLALGLCVGLVAAGCKSESGSPTASNKPAAAPGTPAAAANPDNVNKPGINPTAATEPGVNPLFTLPPSKGPAPHKFQQVSLLRTSATGELNLEMQLTGDGIYRIRDHTNGRSYAGNGELTKEQIADWAVAMKDWESLKDSYLPTPAPKGVETVDIIYDGRKVSAIASDKDLPKTFAEAYKRLLDLNEQGRKEAGVAEETKPGAAAPEGKQREKGESEKAAPAPKDEPAKPDAKPEEKAEPAKPVTPEPAPAPAPAPEGEKKDGK
jgi:hypothetical protein